MARMSRITDELRSLEAHGVDPQRIQRLIDARVEGLAHLLELSDEEILSFEAIDPASLEQLREAATLAKSEWDGRDALEAAASVPEEPEAGEPVEVPSDEDGVQTDAPSEVAGVQIDAPSGEAGEGGETDGER